MTTDELKALLAETTPGPWNWRLEDGPKWFLSPGVLKVEGGMTDGTPMGDAIDRANASLIALAPTLAAEVIALREREARLVEALRWMGAERNKQMRTADYHGDDCRCYRCAEDAVFAALAEIEKEAGE